MLPAATPPSGNEIMRSWRPANLRGNATSRGVESILGTLGGWSVDDCAQSSGCVATVTAPAAWRRNARRSSCGLSVMIGLRLYCVKSDGRFGRIILAGREDNCIPGQDLGSLIASASRLIAY